MKQNRFQKAELVLAKRSQKLAEFQRQSVTPERLAETITEYIEWRAFASWVRAIVETEGYVSMGMKASLEARCPGSWSLHLRRTRDRHRCGSAERPGLMNTSSPMLKPKAGPMPWATTRFEIHGATRSRTIGCTVTTLGNAVAPLLFRLLKNGAIARLILHGAVNRRRRSPRRLSVLLSLFASVVRNPE